MVRKKAFKQISELEQVSELPNPFRFQDGAPVLNQVDWLKRRDEIKALIQHYGYGYLPDEPCEVKATLTGDDLRISVQANGHEAAFHATVTLPQTGRAQYPVFIYMETPNLGVKFLNEDIFLNREYALVKFVPSDVAADDPEQRGAFYSLYPDLDTGVLMAWAWGFHRVIDALTQVQQMDTEKIAVTGWSRLGKASVLAGAFDERIQLTVPANSGLSGAGNYRYFYEESAPNEKIENIFGYAPQWFSPRLGEFVGQATRLPFDQHEVMALIAPRALLITAGTEDYWSNPQGTGLSYKAAKKVFDFLGANEHIGIAYRKGEHLLTSDDFHAMVDFADQVFQIKNGKRNFDEIPYTYPEENAAIPWDAPQE